MTRRLDNGTVVFEVEPPEACAFCHEFRELRPYGPNRERICFQCAMEDEETTARRFTEDVCGEEYKPLPHGTCQQCGQRRLIGPDGFCHQCRGELLLTGRLPQTTNPMQHGAAMWMALALHALRAGDCLPLLAALRGFTKLLQRLAAA